MAIRSKSSAKRSPAVKSRATTAKKPVKKVSVSKAVATKKTVKKAAPVAKRSSLKKSASKRSAASKPKSGKIHHRVHHHVKRHVMRYLGGATALFVLTFASQTGLGEAAQNKVTGSTKAQKGYMLIYSQGGKFETATVTTSGYGSVVANNKKVCSGSAFSKEGKSTVKLSKTGKKISCTAVSGNGQYNIAYTGGRTVTVDIDAGYCTFVHENAGKIRKVPASKSGACEKDDKNDIIVRENAGMRVLTSLGKNNKSMTGFVEVTGNNFQITKSFCTGQVDLQLKDQSGKVIKSKRAAIKYVNDKKNKPYCVAKYSFTALPNGNYNVTANYPGGKYFNPGSATGSNIGVTGTKPKTGTGR